MPLGESGGEADASTNLYLTIGTFGGEGQEESGGLGRPIKAGPMILVASGLRSQRYDCKLLNTDVTGKLILRLTAGGFEPLAESVSAHFQHPESGPQWAFEDPPPL